MVDKNKKQKDLERALNFSDNSNSYHSVRKGTPHSNILKEIKRSKPSGSVVTSNLNNINGHINNQSSTSKQDLVSKLQDLNNKK